MHARAVTLTPLGQWLRQLNRCLRAAAQDVWQEVLRCVSRWELLVQVAGGGMTDALIFAAPAESPTAAKRRPFFSMRSAKADAGAARLPAAPLSVCLRLCEPTPRLCAAPSVKASAC